MTYIATLFLASLYVLSLSLNAAADNHTNSLENIEKLVNNMREYVQAGNYPKALEELSWLRRDLEKLDFDVTLKYFPDDVNGFKGESATTQSALGVTTIERIYKKDNQTITVSLLEGV